MAQQIPGGNIPQNYANRAQDMMRQKRETEESFEQEDTFNFANLRLKRSPKGTGRLPNTKG